VSAIARARRAWWGVRHELRWARRHVTVGSWAYCTDILWYRLAALWPNAPGRDRVRSITTDQAITIRYRRNRGDIQGIREIFIDEIYRLPLGAEPRSLVDFGANIGLATLWLAAHYPLSAMVAVEPVPANAAILRDNVATNNLDCRVVEAAIGLAAGTAHFDLGPGSNMGHIASSGMEVNVIAINELMAELRPEPLLCKMDIEGAEGPLLTGESAGWLDRVAMLVCELHPPIVDVALIESTVVSKGFRYFPPVEQTHGHERSKRERLFVREPTSLRR
jgi:FkbM family methyltransferase